VPYGSSWVSSTSVFYVVALIFIIFDVEVALLYPGPWSIQRLGFLAFSKRSSSFVILLAGLAYLWKEGDLEWVRTLQDAPAKKGANMSSIPRTAPRPDLPAAIPPPVRRFRGPRRTHGGNADLFVNWARKSSLWYLLFATAFAAASR